MLWPPVNWPLLVSRLSWLRSWPLSRWPGFGPAVPLRTSESHSLSSFGVQIRKVIHRMLSRFGRGKAVLQSLAKLLNQVRGAEGVGGSLA